MAFNFALSGQSSTENNIRTRTMTNSGATTYQDVIQYYDGLGRPLETIQKGASPNGKDLISFQEYDGFGRPEYTWLPAIGTGSNGDFVSSSTFRTRSTATYNNTTYNSTADSKPYSRTVYQASPLNRVQQELGPGKDWHDSHKAIRTEYTTNTTSLTIPYFTCSNTRSSVTVTRSGNYSAKQLYITITTDEEGNEYLEARNKLGQLVCSRQKDGSTYYYTCYVYDHFGCLKVVLPPKAVDLFASGDWSETNQNFKDLVFAYKYNDRNLCIAKKLPSADWIYYIYDKADRLIFSQDGEQRVGSKWLFAIPDQLGRTVLTGICSNSLTYTADPLKSVAVIATRENTTNVYKGYTIAGVTLTSAAILTADYYDNYDFMGKNDIPAATNTNYKYEIVSGYGIQYTASHKGLLTGRLTACLDGSTTYTYLYDVFYYDQRGRLIQSKSHNHLSGGVDKEYLAYNFNDLPTLRKLVHSATGKTTQTEIYTYTYDHALRSTQTKHKLNSNTEIILSANTYDELGRLKTTKSNNQASLLTTYRYNVRSWLTKTAGTRFTEELTYKYNGNVATQSRIESTTTLRYIFSYDALSRLTTAAFSTFRTTDPNIVTMDNYGTSYSYDLNGNLTSIIRYGYPTNLVLPLAIDNLTLSYTGNQLKNVSDAAPIVTRSPSTSQDFKNYSISTTTTEYTFNRNGAMTKDLNKGISLIRYNMLNLPESMDILSPVAEAKNAYVYTARGEKITSRYSWNTNYSTTPVIGSLVSSNKMNSSLIVDYVKNKVYENGVLKRILFNNGYYEDGIYYFYLRDHLGNNRITANQSGTVKQTHHYYPFGMVYAGGGTQDVQPYKYNGKELDSGHGLNLYDYSARQYDFGVGRFTTIDPMAEKYYSVSPYAYCLNNPVNAVDPDGEKIVYIIRNSQQDISKTYTFKNGYFVDNNGKKFISDNTANRLAEAYRYILDSGNKELIHKFRTIERSKNIHYAEEVSAGDQNGVNALGTKKQIIEGKSLGTGLHVDFSTEDKQAFESAQKIKSNDMSTVVHELQHQYDYEIGNMKDNTGKRNNENPSEKRAVRLENIARELEGIELRKKY